MKCIALAKLKTSIVIGMVGVYNPVYRP